MDQAIVFSLAALAAVFGCGFFFSGKKRLATNIFLIAGLLFVSYTLGKSILSENRLNRGSAAIDADRVEFMLRVSSAMDSIWYRNPLHNAFSPKQQDVFPEAIKALRNVADSDAGSPLIWAEVAIAEHQGKRNPKEALEHLLSLPKDDRGHRLGECLSTLYSQKKISAAQTASLKTCLDSELATGWYKDVTMLELYRSTGQKDKYDACKIKFEERGTVLIEKMVGFVICGLLAILIGLLTIFVQLLFFGRDLNNEAERKLIQAPADYGWKTVLGVFIAWLSTQLVVGLIAQSLMKNISPLGGLSKTMTAGKDGVMLAAVVLSVLYVLSNGPGILFAYLIALRPRGIAFAEGLKLRLKVNANGPIRLVLIGVLTWFAAVPLVLISYWIAIKLFHSTGSSNPVICLVMEAARSANPVATVIFYLTLGVLAPFCEETLFRGFLYSSLRRTLSVLPSMIISAALFAGLHLDAGGFLPLFVLGCLFAFVFERTKSIVPSIVAHGLWNSGTFTLVLLLFGN